LKIIESIDDFVKLPASLKRSSNPMVDYKQAGVDVEAGDALVDWLKATSPERWPHQDRLIDGIGGFAAMRALSTRNDAPEKASRPYDKDRDGFVMGEGGAALILEEYEIAKKRGARIYAEVLGYGLSGDAYHVTLPAPEGEGGLRAMKMALQKAARRGLKEEDINYVNSHGTSTPAGDAEEARAIAGLFKNAPSHLQVSSTKSMTGHLLGAAGAAESVFSILAVREGVIPPTINLDNLDPACAETGLNFTANTAARRKVKAALSNSFGFGGTNACLIFGGV
jgi:3-oxoacyl-[acyl-carrier-protein] synthase II